jgi:hypothetical protein
MVIVARSSIARRNGPFGIATTIVIFIEYTIWFGMVETILAIGRESPY